MPTRNRFRPAFLLLGAAGLSLTVAALLSAASAWLGLRSPHSPGVQVSGWVLCGLAALVLSLAPVFRRRHLAAVHDVAVAVLAGLLIAFCLSVAWWHHVLRVPDLLVASALLTVGTLGVSLAVARAAARGGFTLRHLLPLAPILSISVFIIVTTLWIVLFVE